MSKPITVVIKEVTSAGGHSGISTENASIGYLLNVSGMTCLTPGLCSI